jgi:hypothetical protein
MPNVSSSNQNESSSDESEELSPHREIRAAKISVQRTGHGVTMTIAAGKLRLRFYIDAQWNDLIRKTAVGTGDLNHLVPFRMAPFRIEENEDFVSARTIDAAAIPGLSQDNPLYGMPLWNASFPPEDQRSNPQR